MQHYIAAPATRDQCPTGPGPCPWVRCRHHSFVQSAPGDRLALVPVERLAHRPATLSGDLVADESALVADLAARVRAMPSTCALRVIEERNGATLPELAEALGIGRNSAGPIKAQALAALRAVL